MSMSIFYTSISFQPGTWIIKIQLWSLSSIINCVWNGMSFDHTMYSKAYISSLAEIVKPYEIPSIPINPFNPTQQSRHSNEYNHEETPYLVPPSSKWPSIYLPSPLLHRHIRTHAYSHARLLFNQSIISNE